MDGNGDQEGAGDAGPVSAIHNRVRQLTSRHQDNRRSWSGDCSPTARSRSWSSSSHRQMSPQGEPEDVSHVSAESRDVSPVTYRPVSGPRNHKSLRYSGGALHGMDQPTSFDHNFDSEPPDKASSSSPPRRPHRRHRDSGSGTRESSGSPAPMSVTHLSRQLPPLVRVQADLAAENLGSNKR